MNAVQGGLSALIIKQLDYASLHLQLHVPAGSTLMLTGPSGSGKTTILRCLAGLEQIDQGWVYCNGHCWNDTTTRHLTSPRYRGLGFLSQDYALFPHMNLLENIRFVLSPGEDPKEHLIAMGIEHLGKKRPHQVSGGERQRAALCQTLARKPQVLLLDEPFSALDIENRTMLRDLLRREQQRSGLTIVQVTHDLTEAFSSAAQIISLRQGKEDPDWLHRQRTLLFNDLKRLAPEREASTAFS
ncbi:MAG: ATP-binding cassette domain-containing protein [Desulfobulbus sp.]|nr:ATP-binding cassette domain-containing protein [Desulfobulbus sp.]